MTSATTREFVRWKQVFVSTAKCIQNVELRTAFEDEVATWSPQFFAPVARGSRSLLRASMGLSPSSDRPRPPNLN